MNNPYEGSVKALRDLKAKSDYTMIFVLVIVLILLVVGYLYYTRPSCPTPQTVVTVPTSVPGVDTATLLVAASALKTPTVTDPLITAANEGAVDSGLSATVASQLVSAEATPVSTVI
jgi:hypothetical protein